MTGSISRLLVLLVMIAGPASLAQAQVLTQAFDVQGLTNLEVRNSTGNVFIVASNDPQAQVAAKKINFSPQCSLEIQRFGGTISVKVDRAFSLVSSDCEVLLKISVPADTVVNAKVGAGNLTIQGVRGAVDFQAGSGNVQLEGEMTQVSGLAGAGSVQLSGTVKEANLRTGAGDVKIELTQVPAEGALKLHSGSGNTTVKLPANAKVQTSLQTGHGQVTNQVGETPNAKFAIRAQNGAGDIRVLK